VLKLKIENFDRLPDGGPLEFAVEKRGFDFGRDQHLDWTLPDSKRLVSGKHCEIRFHDNAYWLTDISTNGTFVNGSSKRVQSPYRLANGDRLSIGEYIILVSISLPQTSPPAETAPARERSAAVFQPITSGGIWDAPHEAPPPIDPRELMPRSSEAERAPDFLHQAAYVPPVADYEAFRKPQPAGKSASASSDHWASGNQNAPAPEPAESGRTPPDSERQPAPPDASMSSEYVRRFAAGAGIPEEVLARMDAGAVAELSGRLLNLACLHIMTMLHARAEAKALSRTGNRTMIQPADNNPLKFMPSAEEALRVMLSPETRGYLDAKRAIEAAFADLKMHQIASLAAMQAAAAELFDDLSPEAIAKAVESRKSLLTGGKGRQWDAYAERWAAKVGRREHGMLGAFLELFAEQYDKLSKHKS
jgi:type VI secretion system protein ImpI